MGRTDVGQAAHTHGFLEVEVVTDGVGVHVCEQGRKELHPGDMVVLRPGAWHAYERCKGLMLTNLSIARFAVSVSEGALTTYPSLRELLWTRPSAAGGHGVHVTSIPASTANDISDLVLELRETLEQQPANGVLIMGRLLTVLGVLVADLNTPMDSTLHHRAVNTVVTALVESPEYHWSLNELANRVSLSPSYLSRLVRDHTGAAPLQLLAQIRAERAAALLIQTEEAVAKVGARVGWSDPAYFSRRFKEVLGVSPSEHRRRFRSTAGSIEVPDTSIASTRVQPIEVGSTSK
ncbi:AraC family transcriptional regulator [Brachybacterium sacelli]